MNEENISSHYKWPRCETEWCIKHANDLTKEQNKENGKLKKNMFVFDLEQTGLDDDT